MKKVIARIAAFIVCILAAAVIYFGIQRAYMQEAVKDIIGQGENFAQGKLVETSEFEQKTTNGKYAHAIAVYWRNFQDINNELDTETNKLLGAFEPKNLSSAAAINGNIERIKQYSALVEKDNEAVEKNADDFIAKISAMDQNSLQVGNTQQMKAQVLQDKAFRASVGETRKVIASYMAAALNFLAARQPSLTFSDNGAINFKNPADQKYFYDLMAVISQTDAQLRTTLAANREAIRANISELKKAISASPGKRPK